MLETAARVEAFDTAVLRALVSDMFDTMAAAGGVGLAAPQIGVGLQVVIFGFERSDRYPGAEPVPQTILINPDIVPLDEDETLGWEGCLSLPGLRGEVPRYERIRYRVSTLWPKDRPQRFRIPRPCRPAQMRSSDRRLYPTRMRDADASALPMYSSRTTPRTTMIDGQRLLPDTLEGLSQTLDDWQAAHPGMGLLVLLPEAGKGSVPALQSACRQRGIPLFGAIFPMLITPSGFFVPGCMAPAFRQRTTRFLLPSRETAADTAQEVVQAVGVGCRAKSRRQWPYRPCS